MAAINCEDTADFIFPMYADIYYPMITQGGYGEVKKEWVFDKTFVCNASPFSNTRVEDIQPAVFLQNEGKLVARSKIDLRKTSQNSNNALTNILITNIRDVEGNIIYLETSGPRNGRGTIFEISSFEPFFGPFRNIEYYRMLWRRAENQAVGD